MVSGRALLGSIVGRSPLLQMVTARVATTGRETSFATPLSRLENRFHKRANAVRPYKNREETVAMNWDGRGKKERGVLLYAPTKKMSIYHF